MVNAASKADFEPMERAVARLGLSLPERDETLANYMFMYSGGGVYAYQHRLDAAVCLLGRCRRDPGRCAQYRHV